MAVETTERKVRRDDANDWEGGAIPEKDFLRMYTTVSWRVASWRDNAFDMRTDADRIDYGMHGLYYNGHSDNPYFPEWREKLPPGHDEYWMRGTWAARYLPDRARELWIECRAYEERLDEAPARAKRATQTRKG